MHAPRSLLLASIGAALALVSASALAARTVEKPQMPLATHADARLLQLIAREGGEGPRGGDNERAGDRQRRAIESFEQIAREAGEGPRGGDNERAGDRQGRGRG